MKNCESPTKYKYVIEVMKGIRRPRASRGIKPNNKSPLITSHTVKILNLISSNSIIRNSKNRAYRLMKLNSLLVKPNTQKLKGLKYSLFKSLLNRRHYTKNTSLSLS